MKLMVNGTRTTTNTVPLGGWVRPKYGILGSARAQNRPVTGFFSRVHSSWSTHRIREGDCYCLCDLEGGRWDDDSFGSRRIQEEIDEREVNES